MKFFYETSKNILDMLKNVGDFLVSTPISDIIEEYPLAAPLLSYLEDVPLYALILGSGIVFFVIWKLASFIIDILP